MSDDANGQKTDNPWYLSAGGGVGVEVNRTLDITATIGKIIGAKAERHCE